MSEDQSILRTSAGAVLGLDGVVGRDLAPSLSKDPTKRALYGIDIDFIDGWQSLTSVVSGDLLKRWTDEVAIALLKPDAFIRGLGEGILDYLREVGFTVLAMQSCQVDQAVSRNLWRYQWNMASSERRTATSDYMDLAPSLLLALQAPPVAERASELLARVKGVATVVGTGSLRATFGATNVIINLLHTADEPADAVREVRVFLDAERAQDFLERAARALTGELAATEHGATGRDTAELQRCRSIEVEKIRARWLELVEWTSELDPHVTGLQRIIGSPGLSG